MRGFEAKMLILAFTTTVMLPFIFCAPVTDDTSLKHQIPSGMYRNDAGYWNMIVPGRDGSSGSQLDYQTHPFIRYGLNNYQKKFDSLSGSTFGSQKRNFDEIDRSGFGSFVKKNFDEIDRVGLGFNKRNFDEIDRTPFGSFV